LKIHDRVGECREAVDAAGLSMPSARSMSRTAGMRFDKA
jgi:hypothetical protein